MEGNKKLISMYFTCSQIALTSNTLKILGMQLSMVSCLIIKSSTAQVLISMVLPIINLSCTEAIPDLSSWEVHLDLIWYKSNKTKKRIARAVPPHSKTINHTLNSANLSPQAIIIQNLNPSLN
jgi:hypothetical protein